MNGEQRPSLDEQEEWIAGLNDGAMDGAELARLRAADRDAAEWM